MNQVEEVFDKSHVTFCRHFFLLSLQGCHVQGFITVKKVPGVINISPVSQAHSIDYSALNLTHTVRSLTFGSSAKLSRRQKKTLARLHS